MTVSVQQSVAAVSGISPSVNPLRQYLNGQLDQVRKARSALVSRSDFLAGLSLGQELRGLAPSYGFPKLAQLGEEIASAAKNRDAKIFEESLEKLRSYLSQQLLAFN